MTTHSAWMTPCRSTLSTWRSSTCWGGTRGWRRRACAPPCSDDPLLHCPPFPLPQPSPSLLPLPSLHTPIQPILPHPPFFPFFSLASALYLKTTMYSSSRGTYDLLIVVKCSTHPLSMLPCSWTAPVLRFQLWGFCQTQDHALCYTGVSRERHQRPTLDEVTRVEHQHALSISRWNK